MNRLGIVRGFQHGGDVLDLASSEGLVRDQAVSSGSLLGVTMSSTRSSWVTRRRVCK